MRPHAYLALLMCASQIGCSGDDATAEIKAPVAAVRPHAVESPNGTRNDDYYWLRDDARKDPDVIGYLEAENAYKDAQLAPLQAFEDRLFDEIVGRIKQDDSAPPYRHHGYWHYTRYEEGREYPIHARKKGSLDADEEIVLDANALAEGHDFYSLGGRTYSPNQQLVAYAEDTVGRRQFTIRVKDLSTGKMLPDELAGATTSIAWGDDQTLFWIEKDPVTLLGERVRKHVLGTPQADDRVVYEEPDHSFYMSVGRTGDDRYVTIRLRSTVSSEVRFLPAADPDGELAILAPRERDHEYAADHIGDRWIIRTNWQAKNSRIVEVADDAVGDKARWTELVPHDDDVLISRFALFDDYLAIAERSGGLARIRVRSWDGARSFFVDADEPAYASSLGTNREQGTRTLRYAYTSLTTPNTIYDIDMQTGERQLIKRDPVLGGFDPADYVTDRLWATARDGTKVPVSIVHRKGLEKNGTAPLLQYGYGSYGASSDPRFRSSILSLLDRGVVYAIAHVRGGQEMGRTWYEDGKLLNKRNTFTDFIDVTEHLIAEGYAARDRVAAIGGSAGGLLMGAVVNLRPDLYRAIVARVPFVDVVTTMLDESIPLTTNEFDEWGNPKDARFYEYMCSYSPYDNIAAADYPAMLVTTGLWDSQVQYFEPAKWVAKLRATKTDANPLLLHTEMGAGHGGQSGRFKRNRETAMSYAFLLDQLGVATD